MSDVETRFHEAWLGMVQPTEGLVVSVSVLVDAQCMARNAPDVQARFQQLVPQVNNQRVIQDLPGFLAELLELTPDLWDAGERLPADLSLHVPEGKQTLVPSAALKKRHAAAPSPASLLPDESTPASRAGAAYEALLWDLPQELESLDRTEVVTGKWEHPAAAKFDRLLRACRVPIGIITNRHVVRLIYAPHGESSGSITFRLEDMAGVGGRPILDAFVMLLHARRWFGEGEGKRLPDILRASRERQANVTNELASQVFEAINLLLRGFEAAAERDGKGVLEDALERKEDHLYGGLLTVLLRLVFLLYAEDRGLMPMDKPLYAKHLSVLTLFNQLQADQGAFPDSMARRFGAWPRLIALFRAVFFGIHQGDLQVPARRGQLFDPQLFPFLEGWSSSSAPVVLGEDRAATKVPSVDDGTVYQVLEKLLVLDGQRLSYRALDVEQIGSVYEALMGYHVERTAGAAVCLKPSRVWVTARDILEIPQNRRAAWLQDEAQLKKAEAARLAESLKEARKEADVLAALEEQQVSGTHQTRPGQLVIQPGAERRRTSSHYTPRSLSAPIVRKTLEPLLAAMGGEPSSERLLNLKVCDPAMGSGAFLVEACRFLGDQVVAAWTREKNLQRVASVNDDVVNEARRLVAQRCLYGVDKNAFAVNLAKLSLWLVTLAKNEPFTFVDHALRHGDSLVGLSLDQIKAFHWAPEKQLDLCASELANALDEALVIRQKILALALEHGEAKVKERELLLQDSEDAVNRARLIGDLVVAAFFAAEKDKERLAYRKDQLMPQVVRWLQEGGPPPEELKEEQRKLRERVPVFHWMLEFPEVFYGERPDPLDNDQVNRAAWMDAFVGNPPFAGKNNIIEAGGKGYLPWLQTVHAGAHGNADLSAHFFRRTFDLLGAHGTIGLIATNTIAQGDTRASALQPIVNAGGVIYDATRSMPWPGLANVAVAVVHIGKGIASAGARLDGLAVPVISSRLRAKPERPDPVPLAANANLSFVGSYVLGMGFTLTPEERERLIKKNKRNAERIFPYLGGEEVNTNPDQGFDRYVISFGDMSLEQAGEWPDLLSIVREKVKPERDKNNRENYRERWWLFGEGRPGLYAAIKPLKRCLVTARVTKHLCFSFQPTDRVFSEAMYVFSLPEFHRFAVLQSRVHEGWARLLSSSLEDRLRYSASDCFETFPFPSMGIVDAVARLESHGERLYKARAEHMLSQNYGLTDTYNRVKDASCEESAIVELRAMHEEMDRLALAAYGWEDIPVPAYQTATNDRERRALEAFEDEVIDRLFALNAQRADEERALGAGTAKPAGTKGKKKDPAQLGLLDEKPKDAARLKGGRNKK